MSWYMKEAGTKEKVKAKVMAEQQMPAHFKAAVCQAIDVAQPYGQKQEQVVVILDTGGHVPGPTDGGGANAKFQVDAYWLSDLTG